MIPQMQESGEPKPRIVDQKSLKHTFEVLDNGEVKMVQTQIIEFTWAAREFLSLMRQNESALLEIQKGQSEKAMKILADKEALLQIEIDRMKPVVTKSEKLAAIAYEKLILEGMTKSLQKNLEAKELNESWWSSIWMRGKEDRKQKIVESLSPAEKSLYLKALQKLKRKGVK